MQSVVVAARALFAVGWDFSLSAFDMNGLLWVCGAGPLDKGISCDVVSLYMPVKPYFVARATVLARSPHLFLCIYLSLSLSLSLSLLSLSLSLSRSLSPSPSLPPSIFLSLSVSLSLSLALSRGIRAPRSHFVCTQRCIAGGLREEAEQDGGCVGGLVVALLLRSLQEYGLSARWGTPAPC